MVYQPDPERFGGVNPPSGENQLLGDTRSDYPG